MTELPKSDSQTSADVTGHRDALIIEDSAATEMFPNVPEVLVTEEGDDYDTVEPLENSIKKTNKKKDWRRSDSLNEFMNMEAEINR